MDRTITIPLPVAIAPGHRIQVLEHVDESGSRTLMMITDLESRIRYSAGAVTGASAAQASWTGRVLECTVSPTRTGVSTVLLVDPAGSGAADTDVALRGADAAADAARDEALRWGGGDRVPEPEAPRFW